MNNYEINALLALTVASLAMLVISLWMAWSLWREVRRLVVHVGQHMNGLIEKQSEVLQQVANGSTGNLKGKLAAERQLQHESKQSLQFSESTDLA
jgi:hypothetical protein